MEKWNLVIDVEKCEDCNNCFLACKDEHVDNEFPGYSLSQPRHGQRWINIKRKERGQYPFIDVAYLPVPCLHCDDAPCVKAAKDGAIYKREDGIVLIDPVKAAGQEKLVNACPYDVIWWNEDKNVAQKCTFCVHLLDEGWKEPRCVSVCPTGALRVVKTNDDEMKRIVEQENLQHFQPNHKTAPRVYYKNLYRYNKCFIGGSVAATKDNITDCVDAAVVFLQDQSGKKLAQQTTDPFGDFKFDGLDKNSGNYTLKITHSDYSEQTVDVKLGESVFVGVIEL